jgi:P-type Cu+ transporter
MNHCHTHATATIEAPPVPDGLLYTCPMHPEIVQEGPGSCPICGMALEPKTITAEERRTPSSRT